MRNIGHKILNFLHIFSIVAIIFGFCGIISLFIFSPFPLWRILIAVIPLFGGIILNRIVSFISNAITVTEVVVENIQETIERKNDNNNNQDNQDKY